MTHADPRVDPRGPHLRRKPTDLRVEAGNTCRCSCGGSVVLVDEATEPVAAVDLAPARYRILLGFRRAELEPTVRPLGVVVVDVDAEHTLEVAVVEDQQPVETLRADGSDEALRDRICLRRAHGRLHRPDAVASEDLVEGTAVLAVAVADQEAGPVFGEIEAEVARLLVTQPPVGLVVQPASQTRRFP